ncbi:EscU/YscU/HrcU family type III secretion system export apparatus switch protein [Paenibacillus sp. GSMTC-2017]|uniref:EscU/YscU/HrcU family type III secretion system export apparatus switch protein n=1 Tax=Paenibacillus sp. GSMTC-2017 TaxID=2794350 RepID=UPI0018D8541C|nr:EscU/YscU/HrcU family type III secretion system export apparatus switch protein [Paenibacillus sp. GSMTC-2017]MBH5316660.1 EscU/YscU/HrcU family type III secretion system export apparatus switch protein [Paenibacillus sp. GSMTC-2017]
MSKEQEGTSGKMSLRKAVALKYEPGERTAPVLIAKGSGQIADRILEKAKENGIPVQEDASLVEVLSKLDVDQEIPPELYALVAEILSFVYQSDRKARDWSHDNR